MVYFIVLLNALLIVNAQIELGENPQIINSHMECQNNNEKMTKMQLMKCNFVLEKYILDNYGGNQHYDVTDEFGDVNDLFSAAILKIWEKHATINGWSEWAR